MTTGATYAAVTETRLFGTADFRDRLLGHLRTLVQESYEKSFRSGCVYDTALGLISGGNDAVSVSGTSEATDGLGHVLDVAGGGYATTLQFENTAAVEYEVGLHYAEVPNGVQINPRSGMPEFIGYDEQVGESGDPDLVTDNGNGKITFRVNSVTEAGVSNAGRKVQVWKNTPGPNATTVAVAIEELTVAWTGGNNEITTAAALGQDTVSTTAADYTVVLMGPTIKRNTTLYDVDGYAFLGKVTGGGAGSPPAGYDVTDQDVIDMSLSDLADITSRNATTDRLKVDVKSYSGDVSDPQIQVRNPAGTPVFVVDGDGNVTISGTTTQEDFVQVNASETITDNLTAGDDDATDAHKIKGSWWHTNNAETAYWFKVDGSTGRIGINKAHDASWRLDVSGNVRLDDTLRIESAAPIQEYRETDVAVDAGGLWRALLSAGELGWQENTAAGGDFSTATAWLTSDRGNSAWLFGVHAWPAADDTHDLGGVGAEWRNLYLDGVAYLDTLSLSTAAGEGCATNFLPTGDGGLDLGSGSYEWRDLYLDGVAYLDTLSISATAGEGCSTDFNPTTDSTLDLGSPSRQWANVYTVNLNVGADINPSADITYDLGQPTIRWLNTYTRNIAGGPGAGTDYVNITGPDYVNVVGPLYVGGYEAVPVGALNNPTTTQLAATGAGVWYNAAQNSGGRVNLAWNAYWDGTDWRGWDETGDGATRMAIDVSGSALSWTWYFDDTSPTAAGDVVSLASAAFQVNSTAVTSFVAHKIQSADPQLWYRETDVAVDAGGLWRWRHQAGDLRLEENTAAGGDFSTNKWWIVIDQSATQIQMGAHLIPRVADTYDLGSDTNRWQDVHCKHLELIQTAPRIHWRESDLAVDAGGLWRMILNAGDFWIQENTAAGGDFSTITSWIKLDRATSAITAYKSFWPEASSTYDLGSSGQRWNVLFGTQLNMYYSNTTGGIVMFNFDRHSDTATNSTIRVGYFNAASGATIADGFGGDLFLKIGGTNVAYLSWVRRDADNTVDVDWLLYNGSAWLPQLRLLYDNGVKVRHVYPFDDGQYDLGSSGLEWRNLYVDGTAYIDTIVPDPTDGLGCGEHWKPTNDDDHDLGGPNRQWRHLYVTGIAFIDTLSLDTTDGLGVATTVKPATDGNLDLGATSRVWQNVYSRAYYSQHTFPAFNWTETDVGMTSGQKWRAVVSGGNYVLQENTAAGGDFSTVRDWLVCDRAAVYAKIEAHLLPATNDTYDLGSSGVQWRNLLINGVAYVDTLQLGTAAGLGVNSHVIPTTIGDKHFGSSTYRWGGYYGSWVHLEYQNNDAGVLQYYLYRRVNTINNVTVSQASFKAATNAATMTDGFGGKWLYALEDAGANNAVAEFAWYRNGADDQCIMAWSLNSGGDVMTPQLGIQWNDAIRTRNIVSYIADTYELGSSTNYWSNLYANAHYVDADFRLFIITAVPRVMFANQDWLQYNRTDNQFQFGIVDDIKVAIGVGGSWTGYLNVGRAGGGTSRSDTMGVYGQTDLGSSAGDRSKVMHVGGKVNFNHMFLSTHLYRFSAGSDWTTAAVRMTRDVDNTTENGGYLEWRDNDMRVDMAWLPSVDDTYTLGSDDYRWGSVVSSAFFAIRESAGLSNVAADFEHNTLTTANGLAVLVRYDPTTNGTPVNGFGGYNEYRANGVIVGKHAWVRDGASDQYDFYWEVDNGSTLTERIRIHWDGDIDFTGDLNPSAADTYNLGDSISNRWRRLTVQEIDLSSVDNYGFESHCVPATDSLWDLGKTGRRWDLLYVNTANINRLSVATGASLGCDDLDPYQDEVDDLGNATYAWDIAYIADIYSHQGLYTFDAYDDLALIEAYQPLAHAEPEVIERGGGSRSMQRADPSTLPWPMLGPRCPSRQTWFLSLSDSISFLLGGIKQLYVKHKAEVAELHSELDDIKARLEAIGA